MIISILYHSYSINPHQIEFNTTEEVNQYLYNKIHKNVPPVSEYLIPTGVYLESLSQNTSNASQSGNNTVKAMGYVWQRISKDVPLDNAGFIFTDAYNVKIKKVFDGIKDGFHFMIWHFQGDFIKRSDAVMYPYDIDTLSLRMLNKHHKSNVVLIPDFRSYITQKQTHHLGLSDSIIMKSFKITRSHFDFDEEFYEPSFQDNSIDFNHKVLVLRFNIDMKRLSIPATITTITPMVFALIITFFIVLSITCKVEDIQTKGTRYTEVLTLLSFLIFIIVVAHQSFRTQILGNQIVFLDLICYTLYFSIFYTACLSYFRFTKREHHFIRRLKANDYLYPKVLFLPLNLALLFLATLTLYLFR